MHADVLVRRMEFCVVLCLCPPWERSAASSQADHLERLADPGRRRWERCMHAAAQLLHRRAGAPAYPACARDCQATVRHLPCAPCMPTWPLSLQACKRCHVRAGFLSQALTRKTNHVRMALARPAGS